MKVAVLDTNKQPLAPTTKRRATRLLYKRKAAVYRMFPFTIILKREVENPRLPDLRLKVDPGSKTTGLAIVNQASGNIEFAAEIEHRGQAIKASIESRKNLRHGRRNRKTRYRKPRFLNRKKIEGWLPPSLKSRVENLFTWVKRLAKAYPIAGIAMELVKFDMQKMQDAEISGVEYQQGTLAGSECREYLLEKFNRTCVYCGAKNIPLQIEHINPRSRGGSNRISNLAIACQPCNHKKSNQTATEFGFPNVQAQAKKPLKDAAVVNTTRFALLNGLRFLGFDVETGSGGLTKFNRTQRGLNKSHWGDAACVGLSTPEQINASDTKPLLIKAMGHGSRQMCRTDRYGFPKAHRTGIKSFLGFRTGDMVKANIAKGKFAGRYIGRVTIRQRASFILQGFDCHPKYLQRIHLADGYNYGV
jgi:5-methylcytosine-specific restriction endonuclease McrA